MSSFIENMAEKARRNPKKIAFPEADNGSFDQTPGTAFRTAAGNRHRIYDAASFFIGLKDMFQSKCCTFKNRADNIFTGSI